MRERSLVDCELVELIRDQHLLTCSQMDVGELETYVQPASVDLPLDSCCYLVKDRILPLGKKLQDLISDLQIMPVDMKNGAVLLKGQTYLARCGRVNMPHEYRGSLSPKSSIGRVDLMVRGVFDGCGLYDTIRPGDQGELWMEISPQSFNVRVQEKLALSQMMIFRNQRPEEDEEDTTMSLGNILFDGAGAPLIPCLHHNGSLILHLGLSPPVDQDQGALAPQTKRVRASSSSPLDLSLTTPRVSDFICGWEAIPTSDVVDLTRKNHPCRRFFRPIYLPTSPEAKITLEKDRFYILATKEKISIPASVSGEMVPFSHHIGELRAHYAGFFDPGFGAQDGLKGCSGVLEVRPHETVTIFDGQPICLMDLFLNSQAPEKLYGLKNNYQAQQGPKLAKYFID